MAKILSQKGYDLILVARDEKKLEEVKKQLKTETKIVVMDISPGIHLQGHSHGSLPVCFA